MKRAFNNNIQRAYWHNYYDRATYMVTLSKHPSCPNFGRLEFTTPGDAVVILTDLGIILTRQIETTPSFNPSIEIIDKIIMPDHAHILLKVTEPTERHFGDIIQAIKAATTSRFRKLSGLKEIKVFTEGFHDRIITSLRQLETVSNYLRSNPRRLAVRRAHPEFFRRVNSMTAGGKECRAYGNFQLLDCPFKEQVVVHRDDTAEVRAIKREQWLYSAANGGVLVSPFISPDEKSIRDEADEAGARFIYITNEPMGDRFKPSGHDFALCEAGRLLIVSLPAIGTTLSRSACLAMNALAATICNSERRPASV